MASRKGTQTGDSVFAELQAKFRGWKEPPPPAPSRGGKNGSTSCDPVRSKSTKTSQSLIKDHQQQVPMATVSNGNGRSTWHNKQALQCKEPAAHDNHKTRGPIHHSVANQISLTKERSISTPVAPSSRSPSPSPSPRSPRPPPPREPPPKRKTAGAALRNKLNKSLSTNHIGLGLGRHMGTSRVCPEHHHGNSEPRNNNMSNRSGNVNNRSDGGRPTQVLGAGGSGAIINEEREMDVEGGDDDNDVISEVEHRSMPSLLQQGGKLGWAQEAAGTRHHHTHASANKRLPHSTSGNAALVHVDNQEGDLTSVFQYQNIDLQLTRFEKPSSRSQANNERQHTESQGNKKPRPLPRKMSESPTAISSHSPTGTRFPSSSSSSACSSPCTNGPEPSPPNPPKRVASLSSTSKHSVNVAMTTTPPLPAGTGLAGDRKTEASSHVSLPLLPPPPPPPSAPPGGKTPSRERPPLVSKSSGEKEASSKNVNLLSSHDDDYDSIGCYKHMQKYRATSDPPNSVHGVRKKVTAVNSADCLLSVKGGETEDGGGGGGGGGGGQFRRRNTPKEQKELRNGVCSDGGEAMESDDEDYIWMKPSFLEKVRSKVRLQRLELKGQKESNALALQESMAPQVDPRSSAYYLKILPRDTRLQSDEYVDLEEEEQKAAAADEQKRAASLEKEKLKGHPLPPPPPPPPQPTATSSVVEKRHLKQTSFSSSALESERNLRPKRLLKQTQSHGSLVAERKEAKLPPAASRSNNSNNRFRHHHYAKIDTDLPCGGASGGGAHKPTSLGRKVAKAVIQVPPEIPKRPDVPETAERRDTGDYSYPMSNGLFGQWLRLQASKQQSDTHVPLLPPILQQSMTSSASASASASTTNSSGLIPVPTSSSSGSGPIPMSSNVPIPTSLRANNYASVLADARERAPTLPPKTDSMIRDLSLTKRPQPYSTPILNRVVHPPSAGAKRVPPPRPPPPKFGSASGLSEAAALKTRHKRDNVEVLVQDFEEDSQAGRQRSYTGMKKSRGPRRNAPLRRSKSSILEQKDSSSLDHASNPTDRGDESSGESGTSQNQKSLEASPEERRRRIPKRREERSLEDLGDTRRGSMGNRLDRRSLAIILHNRETLERELGLSQDGHHDDGSSSKNGSIEDLECSSSSHTGGSKRGRGGGGEKSFPSSSSPSSDKDRFSRQGSSEDEGERLRGSGTVVKKLGDILLELDLLLRKEVYTEEDLISAIEKQLDIRLNRSPERSIIESDPQEIKAQPNNTNSYSDEAVSENSTTTKHESSERQSSSNGGRATSSTVRHQRHVITQQDVEEVKHFVTANSLEHDTPLTTSLTSNTSSSSNICSGSSNASMDLVSDGLSSLESSIESIGKVRSETFIENTVEEEEQDIEQSDSIYCVPLDALPHLAKFRHKEEKDDKKFSNSCPPFVQGGTTGFPRSQSMGREKKHTALRRSNAQRRPSAHYDSSRSTAFTSFQNGVGVFSSEGGTLTDEGTGVEVLIPKGAVQKGRTQKIWFKVVQNTVADVMDNHHHRRGGSDSLVGSLELSDDLLQDKKKKDRLVDLGPTVLVGPNDVSLLKPLKVRIPHCLPFKKNSWRLKMLAQASSSMCPPHSSSVVQSPSSTDEDGWFVLPSSSGGPALPSKKQKLRFFKDSSYQLSLQHVTVRTMQLGLFRLCGTPIGRGVHSAKEMVASVYVRETEGKKNLEALSRGGGGGGGGGGGEGGDKDFTLEIYLTNNFFEQTKVFVFVCVFFCLFFCFF